MGPVVGLGVLCIGLASFLFFTDPFDFRPDPLGQGLVWLLVGVALFLVAYSRRKWRPPNGHTG